MKKLLLIFLLFAFYSVKAQDTKPTGTDFKSITSVSFGYYTTDSTVWIFKGATYGWTKLASFRDLKFTIDSLAHLGYTKIEVNNLLALKLNSADSLNKYITPTYLNNYYLKKSDTAAMLLNYKNAIALRVKYSDTTNMLLHYWNEIGKRVKYGDTSSMLNNYATKGLVNGKLNISDTASMLNTYIDNGKLNTALLGKLNVSDTSNMLAHYGADIAGKKDKSDSITGSGYTSRDRLATQLNLKLNTSLKGANNGLAELDANGTVPLSQMNAALIGSVKYQGVYNALTNTPNIPNADTTKGWYYIVNTAGKQGGLTYGVGDWIISNGVQWGRVKTTAYSIMYEISVTTAGVTTFMIPFPLTDISNVFFNGNSISSDIWSGVGTTSITLNADTRVYDKIKIQN